jgi:MFS family permease
LIDFLLPIIGVGLSYGSMWVLIPVILREYFGSHEFALNFCWIQLSPAIGTILFNTAVGKLYQHEIILQGKTGHSCIGINCFFWSFILVGFSSLLSVIFACLLVKNTKRGNKLNHSTELVSITSQPSTSI